MASAKIYQDIKASLRFIVDKNYSILRINEDSRLIKFINRFPSAKNIKSKNYSNTNVIDSSRTTLVKQELPFRVRFINIGIESYGPNNPPPIGIAVIGYNNYIL